MLQELTELAERSCCSQHHSNKMWGSGPAQELAIRWQNEVHVSLYGGNFRAFQTVNLATVFLHLNTMESSSKCNNHSHCIVHIAKSDVTGYPGSKSLQTKKQVLMARSRALIKSVVFAKHEDLEGETLMSKLASSIDSQVPTTGSLYIFTYSRDDFAGMIKISYTCDTIDTRMWDWAKCGHGQPKLLYSHSGVRHPERVEMLTHFELSKYRHAQRWCEIHHRAHIEWFNIDIKTASSIADCWSSWIDRAIPYDRRGHLRPFWKDTIEFLNAFNIPVTAKLMTQIQELEEDNLKAIDFMDDDYALRGRKRYKNTAKGDLEVQCRLVKIEAD